MLTPGLLLTALAWAVAVVCAQDAARQETVSILESGKTIEARLSGGESQAFQITLVSGQRLRVLADQHGMDVAIRISDSQSHQLVEMDSQNITQGPEISTVVAAQDGAYRVEIRSTSRSAPAGRYELRFEVAGATEQDRQWIEAQLAYAEGRRLRMQPAADARKLAIGRFEEALGHWQALGDKLMAAHALYYIADGYRRLGRMRHSLSSYSQARQFALEAGESREVAIAETYIANLHSLLGEPRKSIEYYDRTLTQWRSLNDTYLETRTIYELGYVYAMLGEARKALENYEEALRLWLKLDNRQWMAATLNNMGGGYEILGAWQKALEHYSRALELYQAGGDQRGAARSLNNLGYVYEQLNEPRKAMEYYERALTAWRAVGDRNEESWTLMNAGFAYARMNAPQKALECYRRSLELRQAENDPRGAGMALTLMGSLYASSDPRKAQEYYDQSLPLLRTAGDRWREAAALRDLGMIYTSLGDLPRALEYLNRALELFRDVGHQNSEAQTLYGLARLENARGDSAAALRWIESAIALVESARAEVGSQRLRASYVASTQKFYELQIDTLMRLHQARPSDGFAALAAQSSERAHARSLLELLVESRVDIRQGVDAALLEHERDLAGRLNAKATRQLELGANSPQYATLKQEISQLENEFEMAQAAIRKDSPHYDALVHPQPLTLAEIQQQLDDDTLLLEYKLGDARSWLWAITNRTLKTYELPKRGQVELAAASFLRHLTARSLAGKDETPLQRRRRIAEADARLLDAAKQLTVMILDPAAGQFTGKRLLIVPDGALHQVTFAALPAPETAGSGDVETKRKGEKRHSAFIPLIVAHEIVILPSVSVIATQRRDLALRPAAPGLLAVFADPVFHLDDSRFAMTGKRPASVTKEPQPASRSIEHLPEDAFGGFTRKLPRLPFTRREADRILALAPAGDVFKATGFKASRSAALDPGLGRYRYLHFATHGLLDSERPGLSALALSMLDEDGRPQDGFLRANDIYNLKLPAELVVLSGCQTGLGK
ncbi:MAG TPA: CHAT domain-containing tetratricopeptide repeat protein, partial [Blastocatellia bacterium]|nr:CHAT domain-containing tetratricopeptide repeat protein [Blastocatellia bacterium]